jgi:amino acid adenylation domain-containing protein
MNKELGDRLAALSPEQIKALVRRMKKDSGAAASGLRRVARAPGQHHPLSSAQERLWFLSQLAPESRVFNNPGALRAHTTAPLNRELFQRSLNEVGRRHEILRTTFHSVEGRPVQVVHDDMKLTVGWEDLSELPGGEMEAEAARIAVAEGRQVFDLSTGPLIAMKILRLGDLDYTLLITSHHIVSDGWSMAMFSTEVASIYNALEEHRPHGHPEPEYQYIDYVYWEREWTGGDKFRAHLDYWKQQFETEPEPLQLPTDYTRPRVKTDAGSIEKLTLPLELAESLRAFARGEGATLFQVLMAAFGALLYRYTGQEEIVVGTSVANRNMREVQNVMGLFINTLPIRTRVRGVSTFRDYLREVQERCREAFFHQELPFEKLIGELNPRRSLNTHPLFQVMFVHQNVPALYVVPGMRLELLKVDYQTSKFDLNLWVEELNDELHLTLYYSRDLFAAHTVRRILSHFRAILESATRDPECQVKRLAYLSRAERESALRRGDASRDLFESKQRDLTEGGLCFHRRFEAQVERTPDAVAVECLEESLSYRELNTRADQLARHLRGAGVGVGHIVGLLAERGPRAFVAVLGIMKAGAAYLPLDSSHPAVRTASLLEDARARVLLTEESSRTLVESLTDEGSSVRAVYLDTDWKEIERDVIDRRDENKDIELTDKNTDFELRDENSGLELTGEQLAYMIYTSGTTGRPKGVCVEHRNLVNYCDAVWREMKLAAGDRFATVSSLAADLGNTMIFPPLINGGCVVAVPQELATDASALAGYLERRPIDCLKVVPSHLRALIDSARARHILPAKLLVLGGEAASTDLVETVRATGARCRILNHYGPTECTIGVLTYEVPESIGEVPGSIGDSSDSVAHKPERDALPTGFPLAGCKVYVFDEEMEPVPVGVAGEIYIGGACVARGYLNRAGRTAERFVPDAYGMGERLYRTGDRAKVLESGAVKFIGRVDRQVKIRGFRVELREIETALNEHAGVEQAVLLPPVESGANNRLVAFIKPGRGAETDVETLKAHLRKLLPSYMIPGAFVFVESMPLTANGKIDYEALSGCGGAESLTVREPPRDEVELGLALIWQELLGVEWVGITDNFFDAGGHSLLAIQLFSRIEERFGQRLPLASLFEFGTVEQLARLLRREQVLKQSSPLVLIRKGAGQSLFFVHPAGGNVLCYYELARSLGEGLSFYGVQAAPANGNRSNENGVNGSGVNGNGVNGNGVNGDGSKENVSVTKMARRYLDAVTAASGSQVPVIGGWSMGALVAFEMGCLYARERGELPLIVVLDQVAPGAVDSHIAAVDSLVAVGDAHVAKDDEVSRLLSFSLKVSRLIGRDLGVNEAGLAARTKEGRASLFLEKFKAARLVPEQTAVEDFQGFLEMMLEHNRVTAEYAPAVYPGKVLVLRADEPVAFEPELRAAMGFGGVREPDLGWQKITSQSVEVISVPGSHITMMARPNVQALAAKLAARVASGGN